MPIKGIEESADRFARIDTQTHGGESKNQATQPIVNQNQNNGLSQVNRGAVRNPVEINSEERIFDQVAARNEVRTREENFQKDREQRDVQTEETSVRQKAETSEKRSVLQQSIYEQSLERQANIDSKNKVQNTDPEYQSKVNPPVDNSEKVSTDVTRNLDLIA